MSIMIESEKCTACGSCREVCPGNLLYSDSQGKTIIRYHKDCWGCTSCVKECAFKAIKYFLGADIGGRGSTLYVEKEGNLTHWIIKNPKGEEKIITIDKRKANAY